MFDGILGVALVAGMVATVNPCGFALLPAYLSLFLGAETGGRAPVGRALKVSGAMTIGFVATFGAAGAVLSPILHRVGDHLPWVTILIGATLVGLGIALVTGRQILLRVPHLERGGRDRSFRSMLLFGVSYAVASLSCTIGPFLAATSGALRGDDMFVGFGAFVAYGVGMGAVITVLTVAAAFARDGVTRRLRRMLPQLPRIAGGLLVLAGAYVIWYGWWELRLQEDLTASDPVTDAALAVQGTLAQWVDAHGLTAVAISVPVLVALGLWRRRRVRAGVADPTGDVDRDPTTPVR